MGGCMSSPGEGCAGGRLKPRRRPRRRIRVSRRRLWSRKPPPWRRSPRWRDRPTAAPPSATMDAALTGTPKEEAWFDTTLSLESDCDEDFLSVPEVPSSDLQLKGLKVSETAIGNSAHNVNSQESNTSKHFASHDEASTVYADEIVAGDGRILDPCGILPNNCLPCLVPVEKKGSLSSSPPGSRKKATLRLSFKWRSGEGHTPNTLLSTKSFVERPLAASQVPYCLLEKNMPDCWSNIEPGTFKVRGENYLRDKKKEFAQNCAAYYPFGVDVFLCKQKIDHIARFVELPSVNSSGKFPSVLVVNVQIPLYSAAIFQNETNGEGMSYVLYFRLSENFSKEFPMHFQENLRKIIDDEVEKVKGFAVDTILPVRERLKILGRVVNIDDLHLSAAERKLMHAYNEKPVLSRPQHEFYLARFEAFLDRLKICVLDVGLTIQGNKPEELPEQVLCCIRLNQINYSSYQQLAVPCS
ncbi:unnamed protein product [Spirodela intermedia]|uniref:Protein ENHANCED DISEASE RESISTANCE 2 C-terminal domain-containing protein n=1 Tax=Spirodela intermedia TaxID=51605 RepID=A0A7I8JC25_SPIIN|nr:unnamed protein product [Spirodela intermedia]CAA6667285.1 unnamed protein product [Spirodela intermedia]